MENFYSFKFPLGLTGKLIEGIGEFAQDIAAVLYFPNSRKVLGYALYVTV